MPAPSEDDWPPDGHSERQDRAPNQADSGYAAQLAGRYKRFRKTASATLRAKICGQSLCGANLFRVTRDLIRGHALPGAGWSEEPIGTEVNRRLGQHQAARRTCPQLAKLGHSDIEDFQMPLLLVGWRTPIDDMRRKDQNPNWPRVEHECQMRITLRSRG